MGKRGNEATKAHTIREEQLNQGAVLHPRDNGPIHGKMPSCNDVRAFHKYIVATEALIKCIFLTLIRSWFKMDGI